jgi:hypothetical protein
VYNAAHSNIAIICIAVMLIVSCNKSNISGSADVLMDEEVNEYYINCHGGGYINIGEVAIIAIEEHNGETEHTEASVIPCPGCEMPSTEVLDAATINITFYQRGEYNINVETESKDAQPSGCVVVYHVIDPESDFFVMCPSIGRFVIPAYIEIEATVVGGIPPIISRWDTIVLPSGIPEEDEELFHAVGNRCNGLIIEEGNYIFRYSAIDNVGRERTCDVEIEGKLDEQIVIKLIWNPPDNSCVSSDELPDCDPTDEDLHILKLGEEEVWFNERDCHFSNCMITNNTTERYWEGSKANLFRDDRNGYGPEITVISNPQLTDRYAIAIHNYKNVIVPFDTFMVEAYIYTYCGGALMEDIGPIEFYDTFDFAVVAIVEWKDGECSIEILDDGKGNPIFLTSEAAHSSFI